MRDWLRLLLMVFYAPARAMAEVRDRTPFGQAALLALMVQFVYTSYTLWPYLSDGFAAPSAFNLLAILMRSIQTLLFTAIVLVPIIIFVANLFDRRGSFSLALQQEFATTASTFLYARAAANLIALPLLFLARKSGFENENHEQVKRVADLLVEQGFIRAEDLTQILNPQLLLESFARTLMLPLFVVWLIIAVREVFRLSWLRTLSIVIISGIILIPVGAIVEPLFRWVLASPFLFLLLFFLMRGYLSELLSGQRARAAFKQNLEAATLNPADASAHYNLGLIHLQRKELDQARQRFERAVTIDADEIDAHYQLGRIARMQNRLTDAIKHFEQVVTRDEGHAQHEIWREIGATYLAAGQFADARDALERFLDNRQSNPEGLYLMGRALAGMGRRREAVEAMKACIEAVKTSPAYKYRIEKRWLNEAQQFLRSQA